MFKENFERIYEHDESIPTVYLIENRQIVNMVYEMLPSM